MKHLLVDALSVNNLSGRHVLLGHVRELARQLSSQWRLTLLHGQANAGIVADLPPGVAVKSLQLGSGWLSRSLWMKKNAAALCRELQVDAVFSPSGMLSVGCPCPQIVLAQNPWPLVPGMAKRGERVKAQLQRIAFNRAQRHARVMVFNSHYMQNLYARALGDRNGATVVAYQGLDETLFSSAHLSDHGASRRPLLLSVSVMARHKAVEVLVAAFAQVALQVADSELVLVGGWPDPSYRAEIEGLITALGLAGRVNIVGHVDNANLHRLYSEARVFALLSRCESFGIPAVEAQAFATPVVVAAGTAAPEIVGAGGISVAQDDITAAAQAIGELMQNDARWHALSRAAQANAQRFHWPDCSQPLVAAIEEFGRTLD